MIFFVHLSYKFSYKFEIVVRKDMSFRTKSLFICTENVQKNVRKISNKINYIYIKKYVLYVCTYTTYLPVVLCLFGVVCRKGLYICTKHHGGTDRLTYGPATSLAGDARNRQPPSRTGF
jgi:hypothetical protein